MTSVNVSSLTIVFERMRHEDKRGRERGHGGSVATRDTDLGGDHGRGLRTPGLDRGHREGADQPPGQEEGGGGASRGAALSLLAPADPRGLCRRRKPGPAGSPVRRASGPAGHALFPERQAQRRGHRRAEGPGRQDRQMSAAVLSEIVGANLALAGGGAAGLVPRGPGRRRLGAGAAYLLWLTPPLCALAALSPAPIAATPLAPIVLSDSQT